VAPPRRRAGDAIAMQQLAARLDEDGQPDDAERWLVRAAEADDHFAHFVRVRLYLRLDEAGRTDEADAWLRRDIDAGETSSLVILTGRLELAGHNGEAAKLKAQATVRSGLCQPNRRRPGRAQATHVAYGTSTRPAHFGCQSRWSSSLTVGSRSVSAWARSKRTTKAVAKL
jgi:hypothetical protein